MKRFQPLVFSAALLLLAACGQDTRPEAAAPGFSFSIDPAAGSVNLTSADAQALKALQLGECGSGEPRILFPEEELALTAYDATFLPGNMLEITAEFTNVTDFIFEQPFTFTRADSTRNIVSSNEPEVTDAALGGDGQLSPGETTATLTFAVEHRGQPFTYEVFAEAVVDCGDGGTDPGTPAPGDPTLADLGVVKTGPAEVVLDANGDATLGYSVTVTNNGGAIAEGVELTDTFLIDLSAFAGGITADLTATLLPDGCILQADAAVEDNLVAVCTLGALASGGSTTLDFTFGVDLLGDLTLINGPIAVSNIADAITTSAEDLLGDNTAIVDTALTTAPVAALADLAVTKTGDTAVTFDSTGAATLNYSVAVANNGSVLAEGVELRDTLTIALPAGITADLTATALPAGCVIDATVVDAEVVICTVGPLDAGAIANLGFTFAVDLNGDLTTITGPIAVTNTADGTTLTEESDLTNNTALVDTALTAAPVANLAVTKTGDATVTTDANGDATLNYSVVVTNNGDVIAEGTELTDTFIIDLTAAGGAGEVTATVLPAECIIDAVASVGGTEIATCTLGALASGGSSTLNFSFLVDLPVGAGAGSSLPVTNTADATTTTSESDLTNNSAVVNSTVNVPL